MAFFIIIFIVCYLFSLIELFTNISRSAKVLIAALMSVLFVIFSTFYYGGLGDYYSYKDWFKKTDLSHLYNLANNNFEYLYEVIQAIAKSLVNNYVFLRFVLAVLCMSLQYNILVQGEDGHGNSHPLTLMLILWSLNFGNIFIIRSTIATLFCLLSIRFIEGRDLRRFLITTVTAILFHRIAIVWLAAYFVYDKKFSKELIYAGIAVTFIFHNSLPSIIVMFSSLFGSSIHGKVSRYIGYGIDNQFGSNYSATFLLLKSSANAVLLIILFAIIKKTMKDDCERKKVNGLFNIFLVGFFLQVCTFQTSSAIARVATPFITVQFFLLLRIFEFKYRSLIDKFVAHFGMSAYLLLRMLVFVNSAEYSLFALKLP